MSEGHRRSASVGAESYDAGGKSSADVTMGANIDTEGDTVVVTDAGMESDAGADPASSVEVPVGHGRSAVVYRFIDASGRPMARKVFVGERFSKLVFHVLTGTGNPYTWCRSAMETAVARRRVLTHLVRFWFGDRLRLPRGADAGWNEQYRVNELRCEFVDGHHAPLRGVDPHAGERLRELTGDIMRPLQQRLIDAGFDGLVWQAGLGNPVAAANFMADASPDGTGWIWVDLESGVPALFALNPLATLRFYLPRCVRHRRWLFDDVDVPSLRRYVRERRGALAGALGENALADLHENIDRLETHQRRWHDLGWTERSIRSALSRGRIDRREADEYRRHPVHWAIRRLGHGCAAMARWIVTRPSWLVQRIAAVRWTMLLRSTLLFCVSHRFRWYLARRYVGVRLRVWRRRRFIDAGAARRLRQTVQRDEASLYLTDFVVHLGLKVPVKLTVVVGAVIFIGLGLPAAAGLLALLAGATARTVYTLLRMTGASVRGQRRPWTALLIGIMPIVGNAAYPAQLLHTSGAASGQLARFIIYDLLALTGRSLPVWGGPDSLVEHWFNRLGDLVVALARPLHTREGRGGT